MCRAVLCYMLCSTLLYVVQYIAICPAVQCYMSCSTLLYVVQYIATCRAVHCYMRAVHCYMSCSTLLYVVQYIAICHAVHCYVLQYISICPAVQCYMSCSIAICPAVHCYMSCSTLLYVLQYNAICPAVQCYMSCSTLLYVMRYIAICPAVHCYMSCSTLLYVLQYNAICPAVHCYMSCSTLLYVLQYISICPAVQCYMSCSTLLYVVQYIAMSCSTLLYVLQYIAICPAVHCYMGWGVSVTPQPHSTPTKDLVPIVQEAVWAPKGRSGQVRKISSPIGFNPRTAQPIASHYTDWATRPTDKTIIIQNWYEQQWKYWDTTQYSRSKCTSRKFNVVLSEIHMAERKISPKGRLTWSKITENRGRHLPANITSCALWRLSDPARTRMEFTEDLRAIVLRKERFQYALQQDV
jgi:hypothetical protein